MADNPQNTAFRASVKIGSVEIPFDEIIDLSVESEIHAPDRFEVTLGSTETVKKNILPKIKLHDPMEVKLHFSGDEPDVAFMGEYTRIHPISSERGTQGGYTQLHGHNSMHGLMRGKRSKTYVNMTDKEIIDQVLQNNSALKLTADFGTMPPSIKHEHVYQANKTDLQFILDRAIRSGYYTLVRDGKLLFLKRDTTDSGYTLKLTAARAGSSGGDDKTISLEDFVPRLSTAHQVTMVITRTWDPKNRCELVGKAPKDSSGSSATLGSESGAAAVQERYPDSCLVHWKTAFHSQEEGDQIAAAILEEHNLSYIEADGSTPGDPRLKPMMNVKIVTGNKQFDGKYFLSRVRHRYRSGDSHPFKTDFHAKRDATEKPDADATADGA
jgi:phage protein D